MAEKTLPVTKKEAATCQLETAIKLFLENRDLISAYTLCCAADGILEGIYGNERDEILKRQRDQSMTPDSLHFSWGEELENRIRPEHWNEVVRVLNAPQNFFKHADRDHDSFYQFPAWEADWSTDCYDSHQLQLSYWGNHPGDERVLHSVCDPKSRSVAEGNPLLDALAARPDFKTMSEGLSRKDIAAIGYYALKYNCPGLFEQS